MSKSDALPEAGPPVDRGDDDLLTVREVAEMLKLAVGSIYHLVAQDRIPHVHLSSRCLRFRRRSIREWIDSLSETPNKLIKKNNVQISTSEDPEHRIVGQAIKSEISRRKHP